MTNVTQWHLSTIKVSFIILEKSSSYDEVVMKLFESNHDIVLKTTVPGGRVGGWMDPLEMRLTSTSIEIGIDLLIGSKANLSLSLS